MFIKIMLGIVFIDSGEVYFDGKQVLLNLCYDSQNIGIEIIYQDVVLVLSMSIMCNMFFGWEIVGLFGFLKQNEMCKIFMEVLKSVVYIFGICDFDIFVFRLYGGQV